MDETGGPRGPARRGRAAPGSPPAASGRTGRPDRAIPSPRLIPLLAGLLGVPPPRGGRAPRKAPPDAPAAPGPAALAPPPRTDETALRQWIDDLALRHFGVPFPGAIRFAPRLHYRAGDYTPSTGVIRLSRPYLQRYGAAAAREVLLHELCHWWLYSHGVAHRENAPVFRDLLRAHGAPLRARPMPRPPAPGAVLYVCPACRARYNLRPGRRRRACGRCCARHAAGRFDERFVLVAVRRGGPPAR